MSRLPRFSRRRFLTAATGATLALPALHAFADTPAAPAPRLLVYFIPNGRRPEFWLPTASDGGITFPTAAAALQPFAGQALSLTNLVNYAAKNGGGAEHSKATGTALTTTLVEDLSVATNHISIDQAIASGIGEGARFSSLQWGAGEPGPCGTGASCIYTQALSWAGRAAPLVPTINPKAAFDRLFGSQTDGLTGPAATRRQASLGSVLDAVLDDASDLYRRLGLADQMRLDQYFTSLRELEMRMQAPDLGTCDATLDEPGTALEYPERLSAYHELIRLALLCDQSRVITFMQEFGLSGRPHPWVDAPDGHHALTHWQNYGQYQQLERVETWQNQQLASLLELLATTPAHEGTLLDETVVLVTSDMGPGNVHDVGQMSPVLFTGHPDFRADGRRIDYASDESLANLWVTLLQGFGVEGSFGSGGAVFGDDGERVLPGILT